jgi:hypothetical protein
MGTGSGADANGFGGAAFGNKAKSVDAVGDVSAVWNAAGADGDTTNGGVGKVSFVPKTNSSIALPSGLRFSVLASALPQFPQQSVLFSRI